MNGPTALSAQQAMPNQAAAAVARPEASPDPRRNRRATIHDRSVLFSVTRCYAAALVMIALLTLGGGLLLAELVGRQVQQGAIINLAGAQRMLSQRIAALSTDLLANNGKDARQAFAAARDKMVRAHEQLSTGPEAPAQQSQALADAYFEGPEPLNITLRRFIALADDLLLAIPTDAATPSAAAALATAATLRTAALGPLLDQLDTVVRLHEHAAEQEIHGIVAWHRLLIATALLLLLIEALLIFRPLARRLAALTFHLTREASTDGLTGLLNRRAFHDALRTRLANAPATSPSTPDSRTAIIVADLDWLRETNVAAGHAGGDALLRAAANTLRDVTRPSDLVSRIGGDEFGLACQVASTADAAALAARISDALRRPARAGGTLLRSGASIGLAIVPDDASTAEAAIHAANNAMDTAKRTMRGSVAVFGPEDRLRLERETELRRCFDRHAQGGLIGLRAGLQPQVRIADGALSGLEALARWTHPLLGPLSPAEFLPVAQAHGCMDILGRHLRRDALAAMAAIWTASPRNAPRPRLALNLSHAELAHPDIVAMVEADMVEAGLPPSAIEIEITEEVLLDRVSENTRDQLARLRQRGARLALDDFGAGSAGLAQILRLPLDTLKIDRTFVAELGRDPRALELIRATVTLATSLGLETIAEGVETHAQLALLRDLGCTIAQGYLYAPALDVADLTSWLDDHHAQATAQTA